MAAADVHANGFVVPENWNINNSAVVNSNEPEKIYQEYDHLRRHCPVAHVDKHDKYDKYWVLSRYGRLPNSL